MPDSKISALPSATVPLAGTEVLPIVQSSVTDKVTAADLLRQNGQTVTTSNPVLSLAQTWNAGAVTFTGLLFNATDTASATASNLLELQLGGVTRLQTRKDGVLLTLGGFRTINAEVSISTNAQLANNGAFSWSSTSSANNAGDTFIVRDAANTLALRNGANAQTFSIYRSYTDASNYSRLRMFLSGSTWNLTAEASGTGSASALSIQSGGNLSFASAGTTEQWRINSGNFIALADNAYDIGASGATRPRSGYFGTSVAVGTFPTGLPQVPNVGAYGAAWALIGGDTVTDAAAKRIRIGITHYTNAEEPFTLIDAIANSTTSILNIGGGTGTGNAATEVSVWTAANNTTTTGTQRWAWNSSGHFLAVTDNTYDIGASGATRPRFIYAANNIVTGGSFIGSSAGTLTFGARTTITSPADGILLLQNNALSDFTRLQFGGTTSSFPSLARSGTTIQARLADNSSLSNFECAALDATSGSVRAGGSVLAHFATAIPAGGTAGAGLRVSSVSNFGVFFGSGAPTLSAAKGSLYLRSDGSGIADRMYVNTDGSTTWTAVTTVA